MSLFLMEASCGDPIPEPTAVVFCGCGVTGADIVGCAN